MERLTKYGETSHENGVCCTHFNSKECYEVCGNCSLGCKWEEEAWSKLAKYEDLEEQGLLLRLPCRVGDVAYHLEKIYLPNADKWIYEINEVEVDSFMLSPKLVVAVSYKIAGDVFRKTLTPYKTLFFTKEEAKAALKEMEK